MIVIRDLEAGALQAVATLDGVDPARWRDEGPLPAGFDPALLVWRDGGVAQDLAPLRRALHAAIDEAAGAFRRRFITDVSGQAQTYERKAAEAASFAADPDPTTERYPFIAAEAAASGLSLAETAAIIADTAAAWERLAAAIEGARIGAKRGVSAAATAEAARAAAVVDWFALI